MTATSIALALWFATARPIPSLAARAATSVLSDHLLITWYGNPHSPRMGVLGEYSGEALAAGLSAQAAAYQALTAKHVLPAYQLVATVAQCDPGAGDMYRRRESTSVIQSMLDGAKAHGFKLVLDVQPGRSTVRDEVTALEPFLRDPDVYLALDPEFTMTSCDVPGQTIGRMSGDDVNAAIGILENIIALRHLPPKVLIVHQFRNDMLPDKKRIRSSSTVDVVLNMDGFGSQTLKRSSYRMIMRQGQLAFAGIKLFYRRDTHLFTPAEVMALSPTPSVVVYQ